jgi:AbiV family abortive infection protein
MKEDMPFAPLPLELLQALYRACKRNAAELLAEADELLGADHHARAFALASTAREELAKAQMAADVAAGVLAQETFRTEFFDHPSKHAYLARVVEWPAGDPGAAIERHDRREGKEHFERRNQALFVGLVGRNVEEPRNVISRGEAQELVRDTREWSSSMNLVEALTGSASSKAAAAIQGASPLELLATAITDMTLESVSMFQSSPQYFDTALEAAQFFLHLTSRTALHARGSAVRADLHARLFPLVLRRLQFALGFGADMAPTQVAEAEEVFAASYLDRDVVYAKCTSWLSEDPLDQRAVFGRYAAYVRGACGGPTDIDVTKAIIGGAYSAFTSIDKKRFVLDACGSP